MKRFLAWILAGLMLVLAGCAAQAPVEKIVEVEKPVIVEKTVEVPAKVDEAAIVLRAVDTALTNLPADFAQIAPEKLKERMDNNVTTFLLDVRNAPELESNGKIAGAVNIPLASLGKNLDKLPQDKGAPIVVYCAVGLRGSMAMIQLRNLGYTNVLNLKGGMGAWATAKMPVEK